ncbi:hypothetical protein AA313_de0204397 [Arthrobotrys entomopaga]|nr:hypothetical protein AA313_de0204397 [Arthrobotrys entomopaga]
MNVLTLAAFLPYLLFATPSTGYFLTFTLKHANIAQDLDLTLYPSTDKSVDSIEQIFETSEPDSVLYDPDVNSEPIIDLGEMPSPLSGLSGIGIAGRISIPAKTFYHPIADYSGRLANSRRLSQILADESGTDLLRGASQQSRVSQYPSLELPSLDNVRDPVIVGRSIPPNSHGRCFEFNAPEIGLFLQSMTFSNFADEDDIPVGVMIFSQPECRTSRGFIGYKELDIDTAQENYEVDLSELEQPVSDVFSVLLVYENPYGGVTNLLTNEDVTENIGFRPAAPNFLKTPEKIDIGSDEDLLIDPDKPDYWKDFDVPWPMLEEVGSPEEEEKLATPDPFARNEGQRRRMYVNYLLNTGGTQAPGIRSLDGSPRSWVFRPADSDDDPRLDASRPSDPSFDMTTDRQVVAPPDDYLAASDMFDMQEEEDIGDDGSSSLEESIYGLPSLWQINQYPELAGLDVGQYPGNRDIASAEEKGI